MSISIIAPSSSSAGRRSRSACTRPAMSPRPTSRRARSCGPTTRRMRDRIGKERGWPPMGRDEFVSEAEHGSLYVGSPETVARKIAATVKALGVARFQLKYSRRAAAAREADEEHRALRHQGRADGARRCWRKPRRRRRRTASNHEEPVRGVAAELFDQAKLPIEIGLHRLLGGTGAFIGTPVAMRGIGLRHDLRRPASSAPS